MLKYKNKKEIYNNEYTELLKVAIARASLYDVANKIDEIKNIEMVKQLNLHRIIKNKIKMELYVVFCYSI